ncbi:MULTISPECIES: EVE domain-containing protein [Azotobacter]|uniref:EVE domain-containing protein n=1 Tax=Azotobacter TaxID=352 RepID=UPI00003889CD|nr:EVE domain-containing protein [Azotobacter vinelandii]GLK60680.1 EVE domain-containing protein [Azotobacter vinelandii]SFX01958.1 Predicted RNA-binding protein, contains PUA-like domain [Azotobacter vinelandii]
MPYWLMKSEPDAFSVATLQHRQRACWDGVRNYQARNFLRSMQPGELFFFYHSSCPRPGIVGIGRIVSGAYPDPSALEPQSPYFDAKAGAERNPWVAVDVEFVEAFGDVIELMRLRSTPDLAQLPLLKKGNRLSVMPVSAGEWAAVLALR